MLKIGETVRYGQSGLCTVQEICEKEIGGQSQKYYVLSPVMKKGSFVFIPCENKQLLEKVCAPLTKEEIGELVGKINGISTQWIRDFRRRSEFSKKALASSDRLDVITLIKTIYDHRNENADAPLRVHTTDDYFLRDAEYLIYSEFAFVLEKTYEEVAKELRAIFCPQNPEQNDK